MIDPSPGYIMVPSVCLCICWFLTLSDETGFHWIWLYRHSRMIDFWFFQLNLWQKYEIQQILNHFDATIMVFELFEFLKIPKLALKGSMTLKYWPRSLKLGQCKTLTLEYIMTKYDKETQRKMDSIIIIRIPPKTIIFTYGIGED